LVTVSEIRRWSIDSHAGIRKPFLDRWPTDEDIGNQRIMVLAHVVVSMRRDSVSYSSGEENGAVAGRAAPEVLISVGTHVLLTPALREVLSPLLSSLLGGGGKGCG